jgi:ADP-heptose:LPS heptosyltransferase
MKENKRILVVGPAWVGDMVMAQSLFITLKQQQPNCQIDVIAPAWTLGLLQRMPEVSLAIEMPLKSHFIAEYMEISTYAIFCQNSTQNWLSR